MAEYVRIARGKESLVVTEKAFQTLYSGKGYTKIAAAAPPPEPERLRAHVLPDDEPERAREEQAIEIGRVLRGSVADVIAWIEAAETHGERIERAERVFEGEANGRNRPTLLDAAAEIARSSGESGGETAADDE